MELLRRRSTGHPTLRRLGSALIGAGLLAALVAPASAFAASPVVGTVTLEVAEDSGPTAGNFLANATDADLDDLDVTSVNSSALIAAGAGALSAINPETGAFTFTPAANYSGGPVNVTFAVSDGSSPLVSGTLAITVTPVNDAPTAVDDTVTVVEDTATDVAAAVLDNDADMEGDDVSLSGASNATGGTIDLIGAVLTFTPDADLCGAGAGSFDYEITDGTVTDTGHATVDITCVNDAPVAADDTVTVVEDTATNVTAGILGNDTDVDADTLTVTAVASPTGGSVAVAAGVVTFTPDADLCGVGEGSFDYTVSDGTLTDTGHATVDLTCVNDGPVAPDDTVAGTEDTVAHVLVADLIANGTDPENDALSFDSASNPVHGLVDVIGGSVDFTPTADYCGAASFDYVLSDGSDLSGPGTVTINITCVNDAGPVAADDTVTVVEDTATNVTAGILGNDTDVDADTLTVTAVASPSGGSVAVAAGVVTFTPTANLCGVGAGSFDYTVSDGTLTDTGHATVDITCVNDAPVAVDDEGTAAYQTAAHFDVLDNDTDVDSAGLTLASLTVDPAEGTATVDGNEVHFVPAAGVTGEVEITYTVSDGSLSDSGLLTVTVMIDAVDPVPATPSIAFGTGRVNETAPLAISWSATDTDGTGVASYEVQVKVGSGAWAPFYTGTGTTRSAFYAFDSSLQWQVRATDVAGNVSDWVQSPVRRLVAYQGGSPVTYTGTWTKVVKAAASGTGYRYTTTEGKKVQLTFTGFGVLYVAPKVSNGGYAKVNISGTVTRVRLRADTATQGVIVKSRLWDSSASRTIKVINDQGGKRTTFDVFVVLQ